MQLAENMGLAYLGVFAEGENAIRRESRATLRGKNATNSFRRIILLGRVFWTSGDFAKRCSDASLSQEFYLLLLDRWSSGRTRTGHPASDSPGAYPKNLKDNPDALELPVLRRVLRCHCPHNDRWVKECDSSGCAYRGRSR